MKDKSLQNKETSKATLTLVGVAFLCALFCLPNELLGQEKCTDNCTPHECSGEVLEYDLVYHWGLISVVAGHVTFSASDTTIRNHTFPCFRGHGTSEPSWDWFYEVNSTYTSYTDSTLSPIFFSRKGIEGSEKYNREYFVNDYQAQLHEQDAKGNMEYKSLDLLPCSFDVISAIYYCRSIDYSKVAPGEKIPLNLFLDGETYESYVRFVGYQDWEHPETEEVHNCIVFKPWLIDGTVFSEGENMTVYVSNNADKIPLYIETDLLIGQAEVFFMPEKSKLIR